ncbi:MAG: peptidyl-prolyl cis-trans isomerase [Pseudomonadales bacterium]|nr:peptidyl-prolyl cis-trans isomerase [Pseudomonadales bacterium]MCP5331167.1 peptidyl-prolyl cis-trans isomerase [Pseudomonadales bacterium]MCP5343631.1 peptidyl-prolyl cis-trans isomerase [Pseudomonadales bacterium]
MRTLFLALLLSLSSFATAAENANPVVIMETNKGTVKIELWESKAPITVANFLRYVDAGFYNGVIFHRVIPGFMVQGGGFTPDMIQKPTFEQIKNEASAELPNLRGTLSMARTQVVDSATAQFFINLVDNNFLNHTDETPRGFGYAVFGEVVEGMDIVDAIAGVQTGNQGMYQDVPTEAIIITSMTRE